MESETPRDPAIWIISTGTEILQGLYPDTNAQWLSGRMMEMGLRVTRHMAMPDNHADLREGLDWAVCRCDLLIMTGGLGPTADDLNRQTVAEVFGVDLLEDETSLREIADRFSSRGRPMPPGNEIQALFPRGAQIIRNEWGTAPGFLMPPPEGSAARAALLALPGPPREMRPMFNELAAPMILERFGGGRACMKTLTFHTAGLAESHVNQCIKDLFDADPRVCVALLAGKWRVDIRLTLQAPCDADNERLAEDWRGLIHDRVGSENIWGEGDTEFEQAIGAMLRERGQTLATAESCTGGLIAQRLTDHAGSSEFFLQGFVTYSNASKVKTLGVPRDVIEECGAVSAEIAEAMALGAKLASGADWAVSVTGVAGPGGGSPEKPVGLVWLGLASPGGEVRSKRLMGPSRDRQAVRDLTAVTSLDWLRRSILRRG